VAIASLEGHENCSLLGSLILPCAQSDSGDLGTGVELESLLVLSRHILSGVESVKNLESKEQS